MFNRNSPLTILYKSTVTHFRLCTFACREVGHSTYVTPTSYLELIYTYKQLLGAQQAAVHQLRTRYEVGSMSMIMSERRSAYSGRYGIGEISGMCALPWSFKLNLQLGGRSSPSSSGRHEGYVHKDGLMLPPAVCYRLASRSCWMQRRR